MGLKLTVTQVTKAVNRSRTEVLRWIDRGWLQAEQLNGQKHSLYLIDEDDLKKFMISENYPGHPEHITDACIRVPEIESCYPVNLVFAAFGVKPEEDDDYDMDHDIWRIDFIKFKKLVGTLNDREQRVLEMRFHFGMTLDETGAMIGTLRERARQIEARALRKLRHMMAKEKPFVVPRQEYIELKKINDKLAARIEVLERQIPEEVKEAEQKSEEVKISKLDTVIEELDLGVRPYNCLKRYFGLYEDNPKPTVNDLIRYDRNQHNHFVVENGRRRYNKTWFTIRNLGRRSLEEIAFKVFSFCGYRIRELDSSGTYVGFIDIPGVPQTLTKLEEVPS